MVKVTVKFKHKKTEKIDHASFIARSPVSVIESITETYDLSGVEILDHTIDYEYGPVLLVGCKFKILPTDQN